ncbi:MAG TPA: hypothetical protein VGB77_10345 [Abditibacteriaceae bacterium]
MTVFFFAFGLALVAGLHTLQVPPSFAQCLQPVQFLQAAQPAPSEQARPACAT